MSYIGWSRSERSAEAIANFRVPFSYFKKELILEALEHYISWECAEENLAEAERLRELPVSLYKYYAKRYGASEWHHVGKFYREIDHYDLMSIFEDVLRLGVDQAVQTYRDR